MNYKKRTDKIREYNKNAYTTHLLRVRADSALAGKLEEYKQNGGSMNRLINELLSKYFDVPLPPRYRMAANINQTPDI